MQIFFVKSDIHDFLGGGFKQVSLVLELGDNTIFFCQTLVVIVGGVVADLLEAGHAIMLVLGDRRSAETAQVGKKLKQITICKKIWG